MKIEYDDARIEENGDRLDFFFTSPYGDGSEFSFSILKDDEEGFETSLKKLIEQMTKGVVAKALILMARYKKQR